MASETVTKGQAMEARNATMFLSKEYQNADGTPARYKRTGKTKEWKRQPERFSVPVKRGLKEYGYITEENVHRFTFE